MRSPMEVQGLAIPAHATQMGATVSSRELQRRSRARHPHFRVARARGYDPASTLTAMDIEGIDVAVMYGTRGRQILCHDNLAPDYAAALARAYNDWAANYCKADPQRLKFAAQIAMHDVPLAIAEARRSITELGAVAVIGTPNPVNGHASARRCLRALMGGA
jgi:predicted TIM-barrel fold metal-dependent hydrolase